MDIENLGTISYEAEKWKTESLDMSWKLKISLIPKEINRLRIMVQLGILTRLHAIFCVWKSFTELSIMADNSTIMKNILTWTQYQNKEWQEDIIKY